MPDRGGATSTTDTTQAIYYGRAPAVVLSDRQQAVLATGDPSARRDDLFSATGADPVDESPRSLARLVTHGVAVALLGLPVVLLVAFAVAAAAR